MAPNMVVSMATALGAQREAVFPNIFRLVPYMAFRHFVFNLKAAHL